MGWWWTFSEIVGVSLKAGAGCSSWSCEVQYNHSSVMKLLVLGLEELCWEPPVSTGKPGLEGRKRRTRCKTDGAGESVKHARRKPCSKMGTCAMVTHAGPEQLICWLLETSAGYLCQAQHLSEFQWNLYNCVCVNVCMHVSVCARKVPALYTCGLYFS